MAYSCEHPPPTPPPGNIHTGLPLFSKRVSYNTDYNNIVFFNNKGVVVLTLSQTIIAEITSDILYDNMVFQV